MAPAHTLAQLGRQALAALRGFVVQQSASGCRQSDMSRLVRGAFILFVVLRYGLDELVLSNFRHPWLRLFTRILTLGRNLSAPRGERLREALERLGPIFVKFGQVLSTRRDLMPPDIAEELAKLQDRVPPFSSDVAWPRLNVPFAGR